MCSTWRLIYNAWNLVLMNDLLQCVDPGRLQSTFSQGKNFLPQGGQL